MDALPVKKEARSSFSRPLFLHPFTFANSGHKSVNKVTCVPLQGHLSSSNGREVLQCLSQLRGSQPTTKGLTDLLQLVCFVLSRADEKDVSSLIANTKVSVLMVLKYYQVRRGVTRSTLHAQ